MLIILIILGSLLACTLIVVSQILFIRQKKKKIAQKIATKLFSKNNNTTTVNDSVFNEAGQNEDVQKEPIAEFKYESKNDIIPSENKIHSSPYNGEKFNKKKINNNPSQIINSKAGKNLGNHIKKNKQGVLSLVPPESNDVWVLRKILKNNDAVPGINTFVCKNVGCLNYPNRNFDSLNSEPSDVDFQEFKDVCRDAIMLHMDNSKAEVDEFSTNMTSNITGNPRNFPTSPQRDFQLNQTVDSVNVGQNNTYLDMTIDHNESFNEKSKTVNFIPREKYKENEIPLGKEKEFKGNCELDKTQEIFDKDPQSNRSSIDEPNKFTKNHSEFTSVSPLKFEGVFDEKQTLNGNSDSKLVLDSAKKTGNGLNSEQKGPPNPDDSIAEEPGNNMQTTEQNIENTQEY